MGKQHGIMGMGMRKRTTKYACSVCRREVGRANLVAKVVQFKDMGEGGSTIRSRTVAWVCVVAQNGGGPSCRDLDPDWNRDALADSPGVKALDRKST